MTDRELEELLAAAGEQDADDLVAELEALRDDAEPSPSFTARVMQRVDRRQRGLVARLQDLVLRPRTLRFNVAMALPIGVAATLAFALVLRDDAPRGDVPRAAPGAVAELPDESAVMVSFQLAAPGARRVAVAGDFNDWSMHAARLSDDDGDGIWHATVAVERGRHAYMFVVDDQTWIVDPEADALQPDGFGGQNAVLRL